MNKQLVVAMQGVIFYTLQRLGVLCKRLLLSCVLQKHTFRRFFTAVLGIKNTETPIFQGVSAVLPKLYLGGREIDRNNGFSKFSTDT